MSVPQQLLQEPTLVLKPSPVGAVILACDEADKLPWWAFKRRADWIATARHIKHMEILERETRWAI